MHHTNYTYTVCSSDCYRSGVPELDSFVGRGSGQGVGVGEEVDCVNGVSVSSQRHDALSTATDPIKM